MYNCFMSKYFIRTYGCQMNLHESEKLAGLLENAGYTLADEPESADVILFVTCCIRENAEQKVYGHIGSLKQYKAENPNVVIAVGGCMTQQKGAAEKLKKKFPFVDVIFGTHNLCDFMRLLEEKSGRKKTLIEITEEDSESENTPMTRSSFPNAWVNVIYGCNNFCTYCIVPYVRGREKSRTIPDVVAEVKKLVESGYKEITLLGQNVNSYGNDFKGEGGDFADLLDAIGREVKGKYRLRFMSNHPKDLTERLVAAMARNENACHSVHLPLQSGSNDVLRRMNRRYTREDYMAKLAMIKKYMPDCAVSTDVMVGFPGESEQDFRDTMDIMEQADFASAFMFVYSRRDGTPAATMPDQIPEEVSKARIMEMVAAQNARTARHSALYQGRIIEILCEDFDDKKQMYLGRDEYGRMGYFASDRDERGNFVTVKVIETNGISLYCEKV
ncbi:MAG: tRNA (N6-isopentenyl adenosine(37)-C2)-methylthiotransferase MiaB [Candidatus Borkfalkiaceae bacterium]|nr:tRNA (N6-isopentenyl adenosine(37)-C2)-methylthiotransferase MiaB [Christensenellaceae bacterium]